MADYEATKILRELREQAGLTQDYVATNIFGIRRRTLGDWETGVRNPQPNKRELFRTYLLSDLSLLRELETFYEIWERVAVAEWDWDPLDTGERRLLRAIQQQMAVQVDVPSVPPYLISHDLVGRETEQQDVEVILAKMGRCAIVGMAGVGKTALAVAVADGQAVGTRYHDGVLWASLGQHTDPSTILRRWAEALDRDISHIPEVTFRAQAVRNAIGQRRMLLVIDDAWDERSALQLRCGGPNCSYLLTTRNHTIADAFVGQESIFQLTELDATSAYSLLTSLAPEICTNFPDMAETLAHQTGGLPLTLKLLGGYLAAPESRSFSADGETRLAELFDPERRLRLAQKRLGTPSSPTLTLQETIALSLESLPDDVADIYYAFGAFAAKPAQFDTEAAKVICDCGRDVLGILLDRYLLEIGAQEQLFIHQALADFARTELTSDVARRHRDYYLGLVMRDTENWRQIESIYDQIQWAWYQELGQNADIDTMFGFIHILNKFQFRRGLWFDCIKWCQTAIEQARDGNQREQVASLLSLEAAALHRSGDGVRALEVYMDALRIYIDLKDLNGQMLVYNNIAGVFQSMGYFKDAGEYYQQALKLLRVADNRDIEGSLLRNIGQLALDLEEIEDGLDYLHQARDAYEQTADSHGEILCLLSLASAYIRMKDYSPAQEALQRALELNEPIGDRTIEATIYNDIGTLNIGQQKLSEAAESYERSREISRLANDPVSEARARLGLGAALHGLARRSGSYEQAFHAFEHFQGALRVQREVNDRDAILETLGAIAFSHEWMGNLDFALDYYKQVQELANEIPRVISAVTAIFRIGSIYLKMGKYQEAESYLTKALEMVREVGSLVEERNVLYSLVTLYRAMKQPRFALEHIKRMLEIDRQLGLDEVEADEVLYAEIQNEL